MRSRWRIQDAAWVVLLGAGLLGLAAAWVAPMTPDLSGYLLHTRTLLEEGNRFLASHDSKGPLVVWLYAPAVVLLGPGVPAAAAVQSLALLAAAGLIGLAVKPTLGGRGSVGVGLAWLLLGVWVPLWAGRGRPEDLALPWFAVAFLAAVRPSARTLAAGGVATAAAALLKISLGLTPGLLTAWGVGVLAARTWRTHGAKPALRGVGWALAGFVAAGGLALGWLALADSPAGWWEQCAAWPARYKAALADSPAVRERDVQVLDLLRDGGLSWLTLAAWAGVVAALVRRQTVLAGALGVWMVGEMVRVQMELALWRYLVIPMVPALVVSASLLMASRDRTRIRNSWAWVLPLLLLIGHLPGNAREQMEVLRARWGGQAPTPMEVFLDRLAPMVAEGDTVFVHSHDLLPYLRLGAPRPPPVLPVHLALATDSERQEVLDHYLAHPPDWIVDSSPRQSLVPCQVRGHPDRLIYMQVGLEDPGPAQKGFFGLGDALVSPEPERWWHRLARDHVYILAVDTGCFQAWRRMEGRGG